MGILGILLLVFFVIIAALLILLVLIQNEEGDSLGGIFAGGSGSAFGSRSGNVLTRSTSVLGALFLIISLGLALVNRSPGDSGVEAAGRQSSSGANRNWWQQDASPEALAPEILVPEAEEIILEEESPLSSEEAGLAPPAVTAGSGADETAAVLPEAEVPVSE
jgi:preprotein translocase subunit SecG